MNVIESNIEASQSKIAVVVVRFNRFINNSLLEGAVDVLTRVGNVKDENITVIWVPGAYELPVIVQELAITRKYDAIIALGTVIRGATAHFEFVSRECSSGLSKIALDHALPVGFGLLTTDNVNQAIERSGIKSNNKGTEAALAVLEMINILKIIRK